MKQLVKAVTFFGIIVYATASSAQNQLVKLWETDSVFKVPESVLYHAKSKTLYVSNIDGEPGEKDLKGSISKMSSDGKMIDHKWATDISAPTGMSIFKNTLYAADVNEVVAIDLETGKVSQRFPVKDAGFLNDITINKKGIIYVSDSKTGIIHQIENGVVSVFLEKQDGINGLLSDGDDLYLLLKGSLWKAASNKTLSKIAEGMDGSTDGIEKDNKNNFIVSCWSGMIYYVKADGSVEELLNSSKEKINSADIGFNAENNVVYVPTFFNNKVVAYQLKVK